MITGLVIIIDITRCAVIHLIPCWSLKTLVYLILASTRFICGFNHCQVSCLSPWRKVWYLHPTWACWWQGLRWLRRYCLLRYRHWHAALVAWWRARAGSPTHNRCDLGKVTSPFWTSVFPSVNRASLRLSSPGLTQIQVEIKGRKALCL